MADDKEEKVTSTPSEVEEKTAPQEEASKDVVEKQTSEEPPEVAEESNKATETTPPAPVEVDTAAVAEVAVPKSKTSLWRSKKFRIWFSAIGAVVVALLLLFIIPTTRYAVAGVVVKKDVIVTVVDKESKKPVTDALVTMGGQTVKTSAAPLATTSPLPALRQTSQKIANQPPAPPPLAPASRQTPPPSPHATAQTPPSTAQPTTPTPQPAPQRPAPTPPPTVPTTPAKKSPSNSSTTLHRPATSHPRR